MSRSTPNYIVPATITLIAMAVSVPIVVWGCWSGLANARNAPILWLPPEFPQRKQFEQFIEDFNCDEVIVVSWEGCTVDDPRLLRFAEEIRSPRRAEQRRENTHLTGQVLTGYEALRDLLEDEPNVTKSKRARAVRRLQGQLAGPGETSCAVLFTKWSDVAHGRGTIRFIEEIAESQIGIDRQQLYLAGSHVEGAAIDVASRRSFTIFLPPCALLSILLCRFFLRSWRLALAVLTVAAFGGGFVLALAHFSGAGLNAVLVVMMPLVLVLAVSSGIHLVNYYFEQVREHGALDAPRATLRVAWWPCTLAAVTTAIGLASLTVSDLIPMRQFGIFASLGLLTSLILLFLVVPGAMSRFSRDNQSTPKDERRSGRIAEFAGRYAGFVKRHALVIVLAGLVALGVGAAGLTRVESSVSVPSLLSSEHPLINDYHWLEENIGPLISVELVVHFSDDCALDMVQRAEVVRRVQTTVEQLGSLDGTMSAATFIPKAPPPQATVLRSVLRTRLRAQQQELVDGHWLSAVDGGQSWRISSRVSAFADVDYGRLLADLRQSVEPIFESYDGTVSASVTGMTPVVHAAQRQLLRDLFASFLTALAFVSVVMMFVLRSVPAGLVAMIPNVFPATVLFGLMGWLGIKVDIGSVMTASVALGIAVDDTIHFLIWFRRAIDGGQSRPQAIRFALGHCGLAMIQTTLVCGCGLLVFGLSEFIPTRRFAWMMFTLLSMALAGDLLLLPALVASPLGKVFERRAKLVETAQEPVAAAE